jgi:hypothetical protein
MEEVISYGDYPDLLMEDPRCPSMNYFQHKQAALSRTTDVASASWIASSHEKI